MTNLHCNQPPYKIKKENEPISHFPYHQNQNKCPHQPTIVKTQISSPLIPSLMNQTVDNTQRESFNHSSVEEDGYHRMPQHGNDQPIKDPTTKQETLTQKVPALEKEVVIDKKLDVHRFVDDEYLMIIDSTRKEQQQQVQTPPPPPAPASCFINSINVNGVHQDEEINSRERLKKHRCDVAGRVWIPDIWGQEDFLKDWTDCSVFDSELASERLMSSARAALAGGAGDGRRRPN